MYEYITGKTEELTPSFVVVDVGGVGYFAEISLNTYTALQGKENCKLYIHFVVREDVQLFFGFASKSEREIFRLLISVSGIGPNTARVMLSSLSSAEIKNAIRTEDVNLIKSVKGIGIKTAQRTIIDLRDKIDKTEEISDEIFTSKDNSIKIEALSALVMLGFPKKNAEKIINKILAEGKTDNVEKLVKESLRRL